MTNKEKVIKKYPQAFCMPFFNGFIIKQAPYGFFMKIGSGMTEAQAWKSAYKAIKQIDHAS